MKRGGDTTKQKRGGLLDVQPEVTYPPPCKEPNFNVNKLSVDVFSKSWNDGVQDVVHVREEAAVRVKGARQTPVSHRTKEVYAVGQKQRLPSRGRGVGRERKRENGCEASKVRTTDPQSLASRCRRGCAEPNGR
jgi:hypothetical protein